MNNKKNRFEFVENTDASNDEETREIEVLDIEETGSDFFDEEISKKDSNNDKTKKENKGKGIYFSFEARIITRTLIALVLFVISCVLVYKVVNHTTISKVKYNESSTNKYEVCTKESKCLKENISYSSEDVNIIKTTFDYTKEFAKKIKYNAKYYISLEMSIYNDETRSSVLYFKEHKLLEEKEISKTDNQMKIHEKVTVDFSKYREEIKKFNSSEALCEVALYIKEPNETRRVSVFMIPLSKDSFEIDRTNVLNLDNKADIVVNSWDRYSIVLTIIASILIIISLIIIYKTTRLLLKVTSTRSFYQQELDNILNEYDNIIVVARDGYESDYEREIVKLNNFDKLLEINKETNKPIIYSRVNNIKSEFLIEDDKLYKFTMKESDYQ